MKQVLVILLSLLPLAAQAIEREKLIQLLATAASAQSNAYTDARQAILDLETNALPVLADAAVDSSLTWQQRLEARICYEHMSRSRDIEALRSYDWSKHPLYKKEWEKDITGTASYLGTVIKPVCEEYGLWYYYLELCWKMPQKTRRPLWHADSEMLWAGWFLSAVWDKPEDFYFRAMLLEDVAQDIDKSQKVWSSAYGGLYARKVADAVPILIERYDAYNKLVAPGLNRSPRRNAEIYREMFEPILSFADSRHADLIEEFINRHPVLATFKDKVAEIRKRPAPVPRAEPPFRLGQTPVAP